MVKSKFGSQLLGLTYLLIRQNCWAFAIPALSYSYKEMGETRALALLYFTSAFCRSCVTTGL